MAGEFDKAEYRRGYREGFVAAINGLDEAYVSYSHGHRPPSLHRAVVAAWRFWERELYQWAEAPEEAPIPFVPPPVFLPGNG